MPHAIAASSLHAESSISRVSPGTDLMSYFSDEIKMHIFGDLDFNGILRMSEVSKEFNNLAKDDLLWTQKAIQIGIPRKDLVGATFSSIKKQFVEISVIAKSLHPSSSVSDVITIESLKNNLSEIKKKKCSDFMRVWEEIIRQFPSTDLSIPTDTKTIKNPGILDEKFGEWIEDNKDRISSITSLFLHNLNLSFLPTSIGQLKQLTMLSLDDNELESLPFSIGQLKQLTMLFLHNNKLRSLPFSIGQLKQLTMLSLNNNKLRSLPFSIGRLPNLKELFLDDNELESLPWSIGLLPHLKILSLNNNKLRSRPNFFKELTSCNIKYENNPISVKNIELTTCYAIIVIVSIIATIMSLVVFES